MKHLLLLAALASCSKSGRTWKDPAGAFTVELGAYHLDAVTPHAGHTEFHFMRAGSIDSVDIAYTDQPADYDRAVRVAKAGEHYVRGRTHLFECNATAEPAATALCESLVATD